VDGEGGVLGGLPPESGGGGSSDERDVAEELRGEQGGLAGVLEEVGQVDVAVKVLALVEGPGLDGAVVDGDALVGVAEVHVHGEVVAQDPGVRLHGEGGQVGGVHGGLDHVRPEQQVQGQRHQAGGDEQAGEDAQDAAQEAAEEATARAAQQGRQRIGGRIIFSHRSILLSSSFCYTSLSLSKTKKALQTRRRQWQRNMGTDPSLHACRRRTREMHGHESRSKLAVGLEASGAE
jgi:hypothetical protein